MRYFICTTIAMNVLLVGSTNMALADTGKAKVSGSENGIVVGQTKLFDDRTLYERFRRVQTALLGIGTFFDRDQIVIAIGAVQASYATQLDGPVILRERTTSDFAIELSTNNKSLVAEPLINDPFVERSFADPGKGIGHHFSRAKSATVIINVPNTTIGALADMNTKVRLLKIAPNANVGILNTSNIKSLLQADKVKMQKEFLDPNLGKNMLKRYNEDKALIEL